MNRSYQARLQFVAEASLRGVDIAARKTNISRRQARDWWDWYVNEERCPLVLFEDGRGRRAVPESRGRGTPVDKLPFVIKGERKVAFGKKTYCLSKEGLYRFSMVPHTIQNVILRSSKGVIPFLRSISLLHIHGNRHGRDSDKKLLSRMRNDNWISATCGTIARIGRLLLLEQGWQARLVCGLTLGTWNTYDNGHTLLEVLFPDQGWVLVDLDMGIMFKKGGRFLSLYELWKEMRSGNPDMFVFAEKTVDPFFYHHVDFNLSLCRMWSWRTPVEQWKWYRRVFHTVAIHDPRDGYIYIEPSKKLVEYNGPSVTVLPEKAWVERFY